MRPSTWEGQALAAEVLPSPSHTRTPEKEKEQGRRYSLVDLGSNLTRAVRMNQPRLSLTNRTQSGLQQARVKDEEGKDDVVSVGYMIRDTELNRYLLSNPDPRSSVPSREDSSLASPTSRS